MEVTFRPLATLSVVLHQAWKTSPTTNQNVQSNKVCYTSQILQQNKKKTNKSISKESKFSKRSCFKHTALQILPNLSNKAITNCCDNFKINGCCTKGISVGE